jgi:hypothetical protein
MLGMDQGEVTSALHSLRNLLKEVYITHCHCESEEPTSPQLTSIDDLDGVALVEQLREVVLALLGFKEEFASSEQGQLVHRSTQLERFLQKLEAESRNHIRIEQQLNLHIESLTAKLEQAENDKLLLDQDNQMLRAKVGHCFEEILKLRSADLLAEGLQTTSCLEPTTPETAIPLTMKSKVFTRRTREASRPLNKVELDATRLKFMLDAKNSECKKLRQLLKAFQYQLSSADPPHLKSPSVTTETIDRRPRPKRPENSRKSMGDFNPKQLIGRIALVRDIKPDSRSDSKPDSKSDMKPDVKQVGSFHRRSPVRSARSKSEMSKRGLFPK